MEETTSIRSSLNRVIAEYKEIALVAIFPTLAIYINVSMSLIWAVVLYILCLFLMTLIFIFVDHMGDDEESEDGEVVD